MLRGVQLYIRVVRTARRRGADHAGIHAICGIAVQIPARLIKPGLLYSHGRAVASAYTVHISWREVHAVSMCEEGACGNLGKQGVRRSASRLTCDHLSPPALLRHNAESSSSPAAALALRRCLVNQVCVGARINLLPGDWHWSDVHRTCTWMPTRTLEHGDVRCLSSGRRDSAATGCTHGCATRPPPQQKMRAPGQGTTMSAVPHPIVCQPFLCGSAGWSDYAAVLLCAVPVAGAFVVSGGALHTGRRAERAQLCPAPMCCRRC